MTTETTPLQEALSERKGLLELQASNFRKMGDLEKMICDLQGEINFIARNVQANSMRISQLKQIIHTETDILFYPRFVDKIRKTIDKELYNKIIEEVNGPIDA